MHKNILIHTVLGTSLAVLTFQKVWMCLNINTIFQDLRQHFQHRHMHILVVTLINSTLRHELVYSRITDTHIALTASLFIVIHLRHMLLSPCLRLLIVHKAMVSISHHNHHFSISKIWLNTTERISLIVVRFTKRHLTNIPVLLVQHLLPLSHVSNHLHAILTQTVNHCITEHRLSLRRLRRRSHSTLVFVKREADVVATIDSLIECPTAVTLLGRVISIQGYAGFFQHFSYVSTQIIWHNSSCKLVQMHRTFKLGLEVRTLQVFTYSILQSVQILHEGCTQRYAVFLLGVSLGVFLQNDVMKSLLTIEDIIVQLLGKSIIGILPLVIEFLLLLF